ncbi:MAG: glutaredoxin family protein [Casimicrobiaceae bacterium]
MTLFSALPRTLTALSAFALGGLILFPVAAQTVYRYTDANGRVVFSDQPPPPGAKNVTERDVRGNVIQNNPESLATRAATQKSPVTLYVSECGEPCDQARKYLNTRGVPHTLVDPTRTAELNKRFRDETGGNTVPAIKVGERVLRGFSESTWATALDQAGYPRTPAFGPVRVTEDRRGLDEKKQADAAAPAAPGQEAPKK